MNKANVGSFSADSSTLELKHNKAVLLATQLIKMKIPAELVEKVTHLSQEALQDIAILTYHSA